MNHYARGYAQGYARCYARGYARGYAQDMCVGLESKFHRYLRDTCFRYSRDSRHRCLSPESYGSSVFDSG